MKKIILIFLILISTVRGFSQSCVCTDCPIPIFDTPNKPTHTYINVSGAINDTLGKNNCMQQVCVNITHPWVGDLDFWLTSPDGTTIVLFADGNNLFNGGFTGGSMAQKGNSFDNIDVCFTLPGQSANGAFGKSNPNFGCSPFTGSTAQEPCNGPGNNPCYTGTWEPWNQTCGGKGLDVFNNGTGNVNGCWSFTAHDNNANDAGVINNIQLVFCDSAGISCVSSVCSADEGITTVTQKGNGINNYILCEKDTIDIQTVNYCMPSPGCYNCKSELLYAIYKNGGPTGTNPATDSNFSGLYFTQSEFNNLINNVNNGGGSSALSTLFPSANGTFCVIPLTVDDGKSDNNNTVTLDKDNDACYKFGAAICFTFLNPISFTSQINCNNGSVDITVSGGYPEKFTGQYQITNTGQGTLSSTTINSSGGVVTISGLSIGDNYSISIADNNGCTNTFSGGVFPAGDSLVIKNLSDIDCYGECNGTATVEGSGTNSPYSYLWDSGASSQTTQTASALCAGTYNVTMQDANNCTSVVSIIITEPNEMIAAVSSSPKICLQPGEANASAAGGNSPYSYIWSDSESQASATATGLISGNYSVTITDNNGCEIVKNITVADSSVNVLALFSFINDGLNYSFTNQSTNAGTYYWSFGDGTSLNTQVNPSHEYINEGNYTVSLIAVNNTYSTCTDTFYVDIFAETVFEPEIPNVFTPNGDGINDVFYVAGKGIKSSSCEIYNRWGELIYKWDKPTSGWSGRTFSGHPVSDGVYYYLISITDYKGSKHSYNGYVLLVRN